MWLFAARPYQASTTDEQFVPEIEGSSTNSKTEGKCQAKNCSITPKKNPNEIKSTFSSKQQV